MHKNIITLIMMHVHVGVVLLFILPLSTRAELHSKSKHLTEADKTFLERQKQILKLFVRFQYPTVFEDIKHIAKSYSLEDNIDNYQNEEDVKYFSELYRNGEFFPRGEIASPNDKNAHHQRILFFDILYFAKNYETFYKTACWARDRVNEGIYLYSLSLAVIAREETKYMQFPPIYEVYPYLFVSSRIIQRATDYYMTNAESTNGKPYIIDAKCAGCKLHERDHEQVLSYFTGDVGLSAFNAYWHLQYPTWYNTSKYNIDVDRAGELFLHVQHQLLSRYIMERISNHLDEIPYVGSDTELPGFYPNYRYHNGDTVPGRPEGIKLQDTKRISVHYLREIFQRIRRTIDQCQVIKADGTTVPMCNDEGVDILGDILRSVGNNPNLKMYGTLYNSILYVAGKVTDPEEKFGLGHSALMQLPTMLRDPLYYQIIHTIYDKLVYYLRRNLPPFKYDDKVPLKGTESSSHSSSFTKGTHSLKSSYKKECVPGNLSFLKVPYPSLLLAIPGVKIENVDIDKLVTYFEDFYVNISNVIGVKTEGELKNINVQVRQKRLNHAPFSYRITVNSDKDVDVLVKVMLLPDQDIHDRKYDFETCSKYPVEIDSFPYKITTGHNVIERNSAQSTVAVPDPPGISTLFKKVDDALNNKTPYYIDQYARTYGFPQRLLLPKGWKSGMPAKLLVEILQLRKVKNSASDAFKYQSMTMLGVPFGHKYPTSTKMNIALGRMVYSLRDAKVPNSFIKHIIIYHESHGNHTSE